MLSGITRCFWPRGRHGERVSRVQRVARRRSSETRWASFVAQQRGLGDMPGEVRARVAWNRVKKEKWGCGALSLVTPSVGRCLHAPLQGSSLARDFQGSSLAGTSKGRPSRDFQGSSLARDFQGSSLARDFQGSSLARDFQGSCTGRPLRSLSAAAQWVRN